VIPSRHVWHHAYWDSVFRVDSIRGISPLCTVLNQAQDTYEGLDMAWAKAKVATLVGLVTYRQAAEYGDGMQWQRTATNAADADGDGLDDATGDAADDQDRYEVDLGTSRPWYLELQPEDRMEFINPACPPGELIEGIRFTMWLTLAALDIPMTFLDAAVGNYYARKADIDLYSHAALPKREANAALLSEWTAWRLSTDILNGAQTLPGGMSVADLRWDWVPTGRLWIDKLREMKADEMAFAQHRDNPIRAARRDGNDAREIAAEAMDFEEWVRDERQRRGLPPAEGYASGVGVTDHEGKADDNA
jgi:hypothetical protein